MKTTNLFKAVAFVAMIIVSIMNSEVKAQDRFITNEEVQNDLIVAKTIFRQSGTYLYNHMRYEFTYDDENRLLVIALADETAGYALKTQPPETPAEYPENESSGATSGE